jgi:hypothetical protein
MKVFALVAVMALCSCGLRDEVSPNIVQSIDIGYAVHFTNISYHIDHQILNRTERYQGPNRVNVSKPSNENTVSSIVKLFRKYNLIFEEMPRVPSVNSVPRKSQADHEVYYGIILTMSDGSKRQGRIPHKDSMPDGRCGEIFRFLQNAMPASDDGSGN